jgi:hypothetical protein
VPTNGCPTDVEEIAESYCMAMLDHSARLNFENHYMACDRCAGILAVTDLYIRAMKAALQVIQPETRLESVGRAGAQKGTLSGHRKERCGKACASAAAEII